MGLAPEDPDLRWRRARLLDLARNRLDLALADMDEFVRLRPDDPRPYEVRGHLHRRLGNESAALQDEEVARRLQEVRDGQPPAG